jgi:hypothetical protein
MSEPTTVDKLLTNTDRSTGCWLWRGLVTKHGYVRVRAKGKKVLAHRWIYEQTHGLLPTELTVDHVCHNRDQDCAGGDSCVHRRCLNLEHLEPTTKGENQRRGRSLWAINSRKTHCYRGHEFTPENTTIRRARGRSSRRCLMCWRLSWTAYNHRRAARMREQTYAS